MSLVSGESLGKGEFVFYFLVFGFIFVCFKENRVSLRAARSRERCGPTGSPAPCTPSAAAGRSESRRDAAGSASREPPPIPQFCPAAAQEPRAAAKRSEPPPPPPLCSRRTGGFATNFLPNDCGRSRRPCPQPQPRGSCWGRRDRRSWSRFSFCGGQKVEAGEQRCPAQAVGRAAHVGDACAGGPPWFPAAATPPIPPRSSPRRLREGSGDRAAFPAPCTAAAPAPNRPHRAPNLLPAAARSHRGPDVRPPRRARQGGGGGTWLPPATPLFSIGHAPLRYDHAPSLRRSRAVGGEKDSSGPPIGGTPRPSGRCPPRPGRQ